MKRKRLQLYEANVMFFKFWTPRVHKFEVFKIWITCGPNMWMGCWKFFSFFFIQIIFNSSGG